MKLFAVMDEDPFSELTWSGSSKYLFDELKRKGVLHKAVSAEVSPVTRKFIQILNFHPNMSKWKFKFNLDTRLYSRMTRTALSQLSKEDLKCVDATLQVGAWYDMTSVPNRLHASYHDGNLAALLNSPFGHPDIARSQITQTLSYERRLYERLDVIFPMSQWLANSFHEDFGVPYEKLVPVGAGINLPYTSGKNDKEYLNKRFLMVGRAFERKGGRVLLKAFERVLKSHPDAMLTVIGPDDIGRHPNVENLGFVDKRSPNGMKTLLKAYESSSVFVMPSLYEPFGIAFAEAMAHRLPCIGTDGCAMPEIIGDGKTGFVVAPYDHVALADRMIQLLEYPKLCKRMGDDGYAKYLDRFNWNSVTNKILAEIHRRL
jgi:alpha-maltose-1-phosphate synthase